MPSDTESYLVADLIARHVVPAEPDLLLGCLPHDQQTPVTAPLQTFISALMPIMDNVLHADIACRVKCHA